MAGVIKGGGGGVSIPAPPAPKPKPPAPPPAPKPTPAAPMLPPPPPQINNYYQQQMPAAAPAAAEPEPALQGLQAAMDNPDPGAGWMHEEAMIGNPLLGQRSVPQAVRVLGSLPRVY